MRTFFVFFMGMLLFACSGGGESIPTTEDFSVDGGTGAGGGTGSVPVPFGYVEGTAFDSTLRDASVAVYDFSSGKKGVLLTSSEKESERLGGVYRKTDGQGGFSLRLGASDTPILVEVSGGYYFEEASGVKVTVSTLSSKKLYAVAYYSAGETLDISVTLMTTIAAGYAEYLATQGETALNAVIAANDEVSRWVGFDILVTKPVDVSLANSVSSTLTDSIKYGFVSAGLSQLAATFRARVGNTPHEEYPSISVYPQVYEDIKADGILDGIKQAGSITLGDFTFGLDTFRGQLAARVLQFAGGDQFNLSSSLDRNKTGLGVAELKDFAVRLASDTGVIFGAVAAPDIFATAPSVTQFLPEEGRTVAGSWPVSALVSDTYGVAFVHYYVDGNYVAGAGALLWGVRSPGTSQSIVTTNFSNGWHLFEIRVTNILGETTSVFHNVNVQN